MWSLNEEVLLPLQADSGEPLVVMPTADIKA
jgi:hypothetical protein